jgi:hypothetical protein
VWEQQGGMVMQAANEWGDVTCDKKGRKVFFNYSKKKIRERIHYVIVLSFWPTTTKELDRVVGHWRLDSTTLVLLHYKTSVLYALLISVICIFLT